MSNETNAPWRDEELLRKKYWDEDMSGPEIADEWGCSTRTITTWRHKHDIGTKPQNYGEPWTDKEKLEELYVEQGLTTYDIAERMDTYSTTICRALEEHGIESRNTGSGLEKDQPWHDKSRLKRLYSEQKLTAREIAERFGCSKSTILYQLRKFDIPRRHNHPHFRTREDGYEEVRHAVDGDTKIARVHRLVAVASGELDPSEFTEWDKVVHHKKPIPWLNTHNNLEVMDRGEHQTQHMLEYHSD